MTKGLFLTKMIKGHALTYNSSLYLFLESLNPEGFQENSTAVALKNLGFDNWSFKLKINNSF
jgi:hypothetical protein